MDEQLKNWLVGVATSLSITAIAVGVNTYVDVQVLKSSQNEQSESVRTMTEILNRIDKTQAVQAETIKALSEVVKNLNKGDYNGNRSS